MVKKETKTDVELVLERAIDIIDIDKIVKQVAPALEKKLLQSAKYAIESYEFDPYETDICTTIDAHVKKILGDALAKSKV